MAFALVTGNAAAPFFKSEGVYSYASRTLQNALSPVHLYKVRDLPRRRHPCQCHYLSTDDSFTEHATLDTVTQEYADAITTA